MAYLAFSLGLLIPWYTGFIWLFATQAGSRDRTTFAAGNLPTQLGFGLFLGYALLQGLSHLSSYLLDTVSFPVITAGFVAAASAGTALAWYRRSTIQQGSPKQPDSAGNSDCSIQQAGICWLLTALIVLHALPILIELYYRPVYPWDAWQTWIYRAKAWFYQGQMFPLAATDDWIETGSIAHNSPGHAYPTFNSVVAFWAATSLGRWSETLVNWPVFLCGAALALGTYGNCRRAGFPLHYALVAVYMLISIPLVDTHLSLAGQADIWMAGFTGLGYVAIMRGLITEEKRLVALGLVLCTLACAVKNEGVVWLLGAISIIIATRQFKACLAGGVLIAVLAGGIITTDPGVLQLPSGGSLGYESNTLHLPFIGAFPIVQFEVWDDYLEAFFIQGSWNLLWYFVAVAIISLAMGPRDTSFRVLLAFYAILLFSQLVIFGFTQHGRWAEDGTAINRLPLHFVPAIVFSLLLALRRINSEITATVVLSARQLVVPIVLAAFLTAVALTGWVRHLYPATETSTLDFDSRLHAALGSVEENTSGITVSAYEGGIAIISSGSAFIDANKHSILHLKITGDSASEAGFFWRLQGKEDTVESISVGDAGEYVLDLGRQPMWAGKVTEIGVILHEDRVSGTAGVDGLRLEASTPAAGFRSIWADWTTLETWSQGSNNSIAGGRRDQNTPFSLVAFGWLAIALLILRAIPCQNRARQLCALMLLSWIAVDARWISNSLRQAVQTAAYFSDNRGGPHLDIDMDIALYHVAEATKAEAEAPDQPILITGHERNFRFKALRAKYWLLPHPAAVFKAPVDTLPGFGPGIVLYLNAFKLEPGEGHMPPNALSGTIAARLGGTWAAKPLSGGDAYLVQKTRQ